VTCVLPTRPVHSSRCPHGKLLDKAGKIYKSRLISNPEYLNSREPKLFSNLVYVTIRQPTIGKHTSPTTFLVPWPFLDILLSSLALLCDTVLRSCLFFLPAAIA